MPKFTKGFVAKLPAAPPREIFHWDDAIKGFGIRLKPQGARTYIVQYRNNEGRTRRYALGKVDTLTPERARDLARDKLYEVSKGGDPSAQRRAAREAITVGELCDWYIKEAEAGRILGRTNRPIKPSTLAMDRSRIEQHVKPLLGNRSVRGLQPKDIRQFQASVAAGKSAKKVDSERRKRGGVAAGGNAVAGRTLAMIKAIFGHARAHELLESNPAAEVERISDGKVTRFLDAAELRALGAALEDDKHEGNPVAMAAVRFLALTGFRKQEALGLRLHWIDENSCCVRFPDTKTGPQVRTISREAIALLKEVPRASASPFAFPGTGADTHYRGLSKAFARICKRAKLENVTPHTLRHTFASVATDLRYSEFTIAGLLGHAGRGVTSRYAHSSDASLVAAANAISGAISAAMSDTDQDNSNARTAEIVHLPFVRSQHGG